MLYFRRHAFALVLVVGASEARSQETDCGPRWSPSLAELQSWAREYYPGLTQTAQVPARVVIGLVFDSQCRVIRHSLAFWDTTASGPDELMATVFPDLKTLGDVAGIADAVPPRQTGGRRIILVWTRPLQRRRGS